MTLASVALLLAAMWAYPGGSSSQPAMPGFDLWHNYFCDLIRPVAHNGVANNTGAMFGTAGMIVSALAMVPLWLLLPRLLASSSLARLCRVSGLVAATAIPGVACTPSSGSSVAHTFAICVAGLPGFIALIAAAVGILASRRQHPRLAALTGALLASAGVTGALWLTTFVAPWPDRWPLPTAQKIAWVFLVAWAVAGSLTAARAPKATR